jgi:hypothetical protein
VSIIFVRSNFGIVVGESFVVVKINFLSRLILFSTSFLFRQLFYLFLCFCIDFFLKKIRIVFVWLFS